MRNPEEMMDMMFIIEQWSAISTVLDAQEGIPDMLGVTPKELAVELACRCQAKRKGIPDPRIDKLVDCSSRDAEGAPEHDPHLGGCRDDSVTLATKERPRRATQKGLRHLLCSLFCFYTASLTQAHQNCSS